MLRLVGIKKDYYVGNRVVRALRGVDLTLGESGFVSILGQSGCGKTTLMNVIGGLDHYTEGDLVIDGVSTKEYKESDWNVYRNETVGFVFQSYNLIPHTSVLGNVELAMTLSGVDAKTRRQKAMEMLKKVGLEHEAHKRPNQLSGGQCQRVAIARALVCDPKIILADEPTGAIDSETSVQIMELLKEISKTKLVVTVTHNAELAETYSDRIITIRDGLIIGDRDVRYAGRSTFLAFSSAPAVRDPVPSPKKPERKKRASMGFFTAIRLSLQNILHKKGRSALTVLAGSIGIICISLILAMNSGFTSYIDAYETDSLAKYPVTVYSQSNSFMEMVEKAVNGDKIDVEKVDLNSVIDLFAEDGTELVKYTDEEKIFLSKVILTVVDDMENLESRLKTETDISLFDDYFSERFDPSYGTVRRDYGLQLNVFTKDNNGFYSKINPISDIVIEGATTMVGALSNETKNKIRTLTDSLSEWTMMVDDPAVLSAQYDVLKGEWPDYTTEEGRNGLVIVVDEYNQITDTTLFFLNKLKLAELFMSFLTGSTDKIQKEFSFDDFIDEEYTLMIPSDFYVYDEATNTYAYSARKDRIDEKGIPLHVSAIVRLKEGLSAGCIGGTIGYTQALAEYVINQTNASPLVTQQKEVYEAYKEKREQVAALQERMEKEKLSVDDLTPEEQMLIASVASGMVKNVATGGFFSTSDCDQFLKDLQVKELNKPNTIYVYASGIENKDKVVKIIEDYNAMVKADKGLSSSNVDYSVAYTDDLSEITDSMQSMIDTITYILIAVAVIAVVVAMLLVAIILYISVQDRTKEIGVLRALGASKGNVANVFLAETFLIGLVSGVLGALIGFALSFPANVIVLDKLGIRDLLQPTFWQAAVLVGFSLVTTVISGIIPASVAAAKDPVLALRTE